MNQITTNQAGKPLYTGSLNESAQAVASVMHASMRTYVVCIRSMVKKRTEPLDLRAAFKSAQINWLNLTPEELERRSSSFFDSTAFYRGAFSKEKARFPGCHLFLIDADPKYKLPLDTEEYEVFIGLLVNGVRVKKLAAGMGYTERKVQQIFDSVLQKLGLIHDSEVKIAKKLKTD